MKKYIGHYKCIESPEEFYSMSRNQLDFPTQVRYNSKSFLLYTTYLLTSTAQEKRMIDQANLNNIDTNVRV